MMATLYEMGMPVMKELGVPDGWRVDPECPVQRAATTDHILVKFRREDNGVFAAGACAPNDVPPEADFEERGKLTWARAVTAAAEYDHGHGSFLGPFFVGAPIMLDPGCAPDDRRRCEIVKTDTILNEVTLRILGPGEDDE